MKYPENNQTLTKKIYWPTSEHPMVIFNFAERENQLDCKPHCILEN